MLSLIMLGMAAAVSAPAYVTRTTPDAATPAQASVGSILIETKTLLSADGARTSDPYKARIGRRDIGEPAGVELIFDPDHPDRACFPKTAGFCMFDRNHDGQFEAIGTKDYDAPLTAPTHYELTKIEVAVPGVPTRRLMFLGSTPDTLRIGYREFDGTLARPAFNEELTVPIGKSFPQTVAVKDVRLTLLAIDGEGLRYRIEPKTGAVGTR